MTPPPRPEKLAPFLALTPASRRLWIAAWFGLLAAGLRLRLTPRRSLEAAMRGLGADASPAPERGATATEIARTVASAAAHHLWTPTCLPRALATWRLCATRGIDARLRIGVRKESGSLAAHAWIEVRGVPIGEPAGIETRYLPLVDPAPAPPGDAGRA